MSKYRILVADDDESVIDALKSLIESDEEVEAQFFTDASEMFNVFKKNPNDVAAILLDCHWGVDNPIGIEFAKRIHEIDSSAEVIMMSRDLERSTLKSAYRRGQIADFLDKPLEPENVLKRLQASFAKFDHTKRVVFEDQQSENYKKIQKMGLEGSSSSLAAIWDTIDGLRPSKSTVLILGENGTGKEEIAKCLHANSPFSSGPFIAINCGAIPINLIESELFGHKKGSFTGAISDAPGKFLAATNGTLFLDEIGDLPMNAQVKLLRAIQQSEITPVGARQPTKINTRIIAATNRDLGAMKAQGTFREDLYYRLNVVPINIPPLRERPEDIKPILLSQLARHPRGPKKVLQSTLALMESYQWPGNVRELVNLVERWANLVKTDRVQPIHLDASFFGTQSNGKDYPEEKSQLNKKIRLQKIWENLAQAKSIRDLAKRMGVANSTAQKWLEEEGINFYEARDRLTSEEATLA